MEGKSAMVPGHFFWIHEPFTLVLTEDSEFTASGGQQLVLWLCIKRNEMQNHGQLTVSEFDRFWLWNCCYFNRVPLIPSFSCCLHV